MLRISKLADYATRVMHYLSLQVDPTLPDAYPSSYISVATVAAQLGLSVHTVSALLKLLSNAGLLLSARGAKGGYCLSRAADQISLSDIIQAVDGEPALTECSQKNTRCVYDEQCALRTNWQYINRLVYGVLDQVSLKDMGGSLSDSDFQDMIPANRGAHGC